MIISFDICHANGTLVLLVHPALWFRREQLIDAINMKTMTTIEHTDRTNGQRDLAYCTLVYSCWHRYRELDGSNLLVNEKIRKEIEFTRKIENIERLIQNFKNWSFLLIFSFIHQRNEMNPWISYFQPHLPLISSKTKTIIQTTTNQSTLFPLSNIWFAQFLSIATLSTPTYSTPINDLSYRPLLIQIQQNNPSRVVTLLIL